jgi:hypothetical protein
MEKEFHPGISPIELAERKQAKGRNVDMAQAKRETVSGLQEAIKATKERLTAYGPNSDVETHLKSLEERLVKAIG